MIGEVAIADTEVSEKLTENHDILIKQEIYLPDQILQRG